MGLLTVIPGDDAIHTPTQTRVHVLSYADGNFTAATLDAGDRVTGQRITAPVTEFAAATPRPSSPPSPCNGEGSGVGTDSALTATAQRIADLQAQMADLHKKLQAAETARDEAASRAAELLAQPEPVAIAAPRIEVRVERNIGENGLARYLNDGWTIIHTQFVVLSEDDDQLHVVLQRTVTTPAPQPEQRAAVVRTVAGTVAPLSQIGDDDEYDDESDDVPHLPALDPNPLMPIPPLSMQWGGVGGGDFTRAVLSARLPHAQKLELLNDRLKSVAREAFNAAPAPLPHIPLGVSK